KLECDQVLARDILAADLRWFENPLFGSLQCGAPEQVVIFYPILYTRFDDNAVFVDPDLNVDFRSLRNVRNSEKLRVGQRLLQRPRRHIISRRFRSRRHGCRSHWSRFVSLSIRVVGRLYNAWRIYSSFGAISCDGGLHSPKRLHVIGQWRAMVPEKLQAEPCLDRLGSINT